MIRMLAVALVAATSTAPALAQFWPTKPVRMVIGFAAGGSVDLVGRIVAPRLSELLAQPVVIETRPGAGGNIAGEVVARATPDGYAFLLSSGGALGGNLAIYTRMPYDPLKDLAPVGMVVYQGNVLIVNPSVPAKSVKEFIALARTRPGVLNYGSGGNGSSQHMSGELFGSLAKVKMVHVPYKGGAPAMVDLLGGQVDLMFQTIPEAIQQVRAGKVRALGVTGSRASDALPGVPTIAAAGLDGFEFEGWMGMAVPPATPASIVGRLNTELNRVLAEKDTRARLSDAGLDIAGGTPAQMAAMMKDQAVRMVRLAKEAGIKPVD
ncbi:MAG: Bug family tripartite tricarboxylate transporter substrate binding protein [bacterium]|jgi:tripartite-type tricarboxylate transporter receptor subunit TctC|nr:tripartite tricarboxylate transporter substrate binding protein [Betaproteobacteria bacterium]